MSNLDPRPGEVALEQRPCEGPLLEQLPGREVPLGGTRAMTVLRSLPNRAPPTAGAWCFVDQFGPDGSRQQLGIQVGPGGQRGTAQATRRARAVPAAARSSTRSTSCPVSRPPPRA